MELKVSSLLVNKESSEIFLSVYESMYLYIYLCVSRMFKWAAFYDTVNRIYRNNIRWRDVASYERV